jgi:hypothetical protein
MTDDFKVETDDFLAVYHALILTNPADGGLT